MQVARLDFDLPAIFQPVEANDVQCWRPSDELSADRRYDVMASREAEEGYFNLPVMTAGSSVTL